MRLKEYILNEGTSSEVHQILKENCKPYLQSSKMWYYRTVSSAKEVKLSNKDGILNLKPRMDRKPSDTPQYLHGLIDGWFKKKFGWKVRSEGVFTYPKNEISGPQFVFPIGTFKFVYSPKVLDLYRTICQFRPKVPGALAVNLMHLTNTDIMDKLFELFIDGYGDSYTNKNINGSGLDSEVVFGCKEYYLVDMSKLLRFKEPKDILKI